MKNYFVAEGVDRIGKTYFVEKTHKKIRPLATLREPANTAQVPNLRNLIDGTSTNLMLDNPLNLTIPLSSEDKERLFNHSREYVIGLVEDIKKKDKQVLVDRSFLSGIAYRLNEYKEEITEEMIFELDDEYTYCPTPDMTFLFIADDELLKHPLGDAEGINDDMGYEKRKRLQDIYIKVCDVLLGGRFTHTVLLTKDLKKNNELMNELIKTYFESEDKSNG